MLLTPNMHALSSLPHSRDGAIAVQSPFMQPQFISAHFLFRDMVHAIARRLQYAHGAAIVWSPCRAPARATAAAAILMLSRAVAARQW